MRIESYLPAVAATLRKIAAKSAPHEACGVLTRSHELVEVPNRAKDPTSEFDAGDLASLEERHGEELLAIWHTHPENQPPSPQDIKQCVATFLPWIVVGPVDLYVVYPEARPYVGRDFVYGVEDCWQLASDWHAQEAGIHLPWFERPPDGWWKTRGPSPYLQHAEAFGFTLAPLCEWGLENLRVGDVILMQWAGRRTNHAAVYLGAGMILHHLYGELSRIETYCGRYQGATTHVGRHHALARKDVAC